MRRTGRKSMAGVLVLLVHQVLVPGQVPSQPEPKQAKPQLNTTAKDPLPEGAIARLGTMRLRHGNLVHKVGFFPDGKTLISADWHTVCRWDAATGRLLGSFGDRRERQFQSIAFSDDAQIVALSMGTGEIDIWESATGRKMQHFRVQRFPSLRLSPDGKVLAVLDYDDNNKTNLLHLFDTATGKLLHPLAGHTDRVHGMLFSRDGSTFVSASDDRTIRFWDVATGKQVRQLTADTAIGAIALSPDGKTLVSVAVTKQEGKNFVLWSSSDEAFLWDLATGKQTHRLRGHAKNSTIALAFAPDGKTLFTGDWQCIRAWDLATGKESVEGRFPVERVSFLSVSADGKTLAAGTVNSTVRLWDVATRKEKLPLAGHDGSVHAVAFTPDGKSLATGCADSVIRLWEPATGELRRELPGHTGATQSLTFTWDGRFLLSTGYDKTIRLWNLTTGKQEWQRAGHVAVLLAPRGNLLVAIDTQRLTVWDWVEGKELRSWSQPKGKVLPLSFLPNGRTFCTWSEDHEVYLWDATTGKEVRRFRGHHFAEDRHDRIYCMAASPDGRLLAFGGQIGDIPLYDLATGTIVRTLTGLPGAVSQMTFSADSRTLAVADWSSGTVSVWEVATGQELRRLAGHQGRVFTMAFSPSGRLLVSGGEDTTALVWDLFGKPWQGPLSEQELAQRWEDLRDNSGQRGAEAIRILAGAPDHSVPFLRKQLLPIPPVDPDRIKRLLSDLDSENFDVREEANTTLEKLSEAGEQLLRDAVSTTPSAEVRDRIRLLLRKLEPSGERLRALRALQVLERIATPQAQKLLEELAQGAPEARLTEAAKGSLARLRLR